MNQDSEILEKLNADFTLLATQGAEVSEKLERGQAESPSKRAFEKILSNGQGPFVVSVLCLSDKARASVERWIAANMLRKVENNHTTFILADLEELTSDSQLNQEFCTTGHVLVVAGEVGHHSGETEVDSLDTLAAHFPAIWPWVAGSQAHTSESLWWDQPHAQSHKGRMETLFLDEKASGDSALLSSKTEGLLRKVLFMEPSIRLLQGAFDFLVGRQQRELGTLESRKSRQPRKAAAHSPRPSLQNDKSAVDVRDQFNEGLASLEKSISLKSERATQPLGYLTNLMREQVSKLQLEDLDKHQSPSLTKLSINGSHLGAVNRAIEFALRKELSEDVKTIQHQLAELTETSIENLPGIDSAEFHLENVSLRETEIWRRVENLMAIGKESHIELARKGFFDVLTAGRQKVFILIMFVSLMGRMGLPNLFASGLMRSGFGLFMATVLIGSMVNAIFVWRREKESQSEKEMSKIKDSLFSDGTKVIEQVEKGKLTYLRDYFRDISKKFERELKRAVEEHANRSKEQAKRESMRAEDIRSKLEMRISDLASVGKQVSSLQADSRKLHQSVTGTIHTQAKLYRSEVAVDSDSVRQEAQAASQSTGQSEAHELGSQGERALQNSQEGTGQASGEQSDSISAKEQTRPKRSSALLARREARRRKKESQQELNPQLESAEE